MYTCINMHICMCVYVYMYKHAYMYVCIYLSCMCIYVYMYIFVCYVSMHLYVCIFECYIYINNRIIAAARDACIYVHICTHKHICISIYVYQYTGVLSMYVCVCVYVVCTYIKTNGVLLLRLTHANICINLKSHYEFSERVCASRRV